MAERDRDEHRLAGLRETVHCREQLAALLGRYVRVAGRERAGDAVVDVLVEDLEAEALQCSVDGRDLGEDVDAVAVVGDHALDPAHLALDPVQALDQRLLVLGVAPDRLRLGLSHGWLLLGGGWGSGAGAGCWRRRRRPGTPSPRRRAPGLAARRRRTW